MGLWNLERMFEPRGIAVVGASERDGSIGTAVLRNLINSGFAGRILPINPKYRRVFGRAAWPSLDQVAEPIDLMVLATPLAAAPAIIRSCAGREVGGAIILAAGGREAGPDGAKLEQSIAHEARIAGVRVIGPNCLGVIRPKIGLNASFATQTAQPGRLAFISQSGAICTAILDLSLREGIGFSHFVSVGSMLDVDFGDLIDFLGNDPEVQSILLYMEQLTNHRKFMSAARAVARLKPIIALKAGRSTAGARAAASHTGAMAGEDAFYDAAFERAGIVRVNTIGELFDTAALLANQPRPNGPALAVITNAGGPGVMAADALAEFGAEPAPLPEPVLTQLDALLPACWSRGNPIDLLGDASPERYAAALEVCGTAHAFDGVLVILTPQSMTDPSAVAEALVKQMSGRRFPVIAAWMGAASVAAGVERLNQAGIPTYPTPEQAVRAFMHMVEYASKSKLLREIPTERALAPTFDRPQAAALIQGAVSRAAWTMSELEAKAVLAAYGLPVVRTVRAGNEQEAMDQAADLGFPLVMKVLSPDITHKTDVNGVRLGLRGEIAVRQAFREIQADLRRYRPEARSEGVMLQAMVEHPECELLLGAVQDPQFGPVVVFGSGGTLTEIIRDRALALPPLNRLLARRLIDQTRIAPALRGYRNRPSAGLDRLEEMIVRLSQLLIDFPEISELDMNPILLKDGQAHVVDARILVAEPARPAPFHLIISPYPEEQEMRAVSKDGVPLWVRPIRPEDAALLADLFTTLSPTSIYYRFFSPIKSLSDTMLARFTQIDYDREIALVALEDTEPDGKMLAVARVIAEPDGERAEFAVLVGDPWHGRGIGAILLDRCLRIARERGVRRIWGTVLKENTQMLALAKKLRFRISKVPGSEDCELEMDLSQVKFE